MKNLIIIISLVSANISSTKAQSRFFTRGIYNSVFDQSYFTRPNQMGTKYFAFGVDRFGSFLNQYDSSGQLLSNHIFDTLFNKEYSIVYENKNSERKMISSKFYFPLYKNYGTPFKYSPCLVKLDTNGAKQIFDYSYPKPTKFEFYDYSQDAFIYATGVTDRDSLNLQYYDSECAVMKIDTHGTEVWRYTINTSSYANIPGGIVATADSGCLVVYYYGPWPAYSQCRATKLNKNGQFEWVKNIDLGTSGLWGATIIDYRDADKSLYLQYAPYSGAGWIQLPSKICKLDRNMNKVWDVRSGIYDSTKVLDASGIPGDSTYHYTQVASVGFIRAQNGIDLFGSGRDERITVSTFQGSSSSGYIQYMNDSGRVVWDANYNGLYHGTKKIIGGYNFIGSNKTIDGGYIMTGICFDSLGRGVGFLMKIDSLGCLTADSCETRFISSIRYYTPDGLDWSVYPNPAQDKLIVNLASAKDFSYILSDIQGRKLSEGKIGNNQPIAIGNLAKGIYLISISDNKGNQYSKKIVKD